MDRRFVFLALCAFLFSSACDSGGGGDGGDPTAKLPLAAGVKITTISMYQGVGIPIMKDGDVAEPNLAPIVSGKDALVRVFLETDDTYTPRDLLARVALTDSDGTVSFTAQGPVAAGASVATTLSSTLNVDVPGEDIKNGQSLNVSVREIEKSAKQDGDTSGAAWPADGDQALQIEEPNSRMKLVLLPVEYDADGSGRLPDTGDAALQGYAALFEAMYPITGIDIRVADPMPYSGTVAAVGTGWSQLLNAATARRNQDGADPAEYYFALVRPAETYSSYCQMGCVAGLSWQLTGIAPSNQVGTGIGYGGTADALKASIYTAAHEVGHLHGLAHVGATSTATNQCSTPDGIDQNYPYSSGSIGYMGYDPTDGTLKAPAVYRDIMSYCMLVWISDYTTSLIYQRIEAKEQSRSAKVTLAPGVGTEWNSVVVLPDGTVEVGPALQSDVPIQGEPRTVELLDAEGNVVGTVAGVFIAYSDLGGGMIAFRRPSFDVAAVHVDGLEIVPLR